MVGAPIHPAWWKRVKSIVRRHPLGLIALFKTNDDTNPHLTWGYIWDNKIHWKEYGAPIKRSLSGWPYSEILPGGQLRHGEPYFNTTDTHIASEGKAVRTLGTGGAETVDIILILGLVGLAGISIYIWYAGQTNTQFLTDQITNLTRQLDVMHQALNNLTAIFPYLP